jgi:hypothetical protein
MKDKIDGSREKKRVNLLLTLEVMIERNPRESGAQSSSDLDGRYMEHGNEGTGTLDLLSSDVTSWLAKSLGMFEHLFSESSDQ